MAEMDLLKLNHEYRLQIMQGDVHRKLLHTYPDVHFSLVIDLSLNKIDDIYDSIFIMNMLSAMSDLFISLSGTELKADQVNLYDFPDMFWKPASQL